MSLNELSQPNQLSLIQEIDRVCIEFENEVRQGKTARIETYLHKLPETARPQLLRELLLVETSYADRSDTKEQYKQRFRDYSSIVAEVMARRRMQASDEKQPTEIGRYQIVRRLGSGAFGVVYEGFDTELQRAVALKVPHHKLTVDDEYVQLAFSEARILASLSHPNILPVFDVGVCETSGVFQVTALINGINLLDYTRAGDIDRADIVRIIIKVADALNYAHEEGVIHRDVKPHNIMIDGHGNPYVVDFGLAMDEAAWGTGPGFVGTPRFMSPEQARGESHRVDRTSDIFSLGMVLTELVSRETPGTQSPSSDATAIHGSRRVVARPEPASDLPAELRRICLKAAAERASDRYQTAGSLAHDLRCFLDLSDDSSSETTLSLEPRGLSPFESSDSGYFRELIPGPREFDGTPSALTALLSRVDNRSDVSPSPVMILIGPSGAGKSSLIRAGLLPFLPRRIAAVCLDASLPQVEVQVMTALRNVTNEPLPGSASENIARIRSGEILPPDSKLLVVIDHFESWLFRNAQTKSTALVDAMRQCDGRRCQFLLIVRDESFTQTTHLMRELEVPLVENVSSFTTMPFDLDHAEKVLRAYGRAYGRYSGSEEEKDFVRQVANEVMTRDIQAVPIRLAAIAESLRDTPWTNQTLEDAGGVGGVLTGFLASRLAQFDRHQDPEATTVRRILRALLPATEGAAGLPSKSLTELKTICKWNGTDENFKTTLDRLDSELRVVTTEPGSNRNNEDCYKLTHGFLVRPVRDWLKQHRMTTFRGRTQLRLEDRVGIWSKTRSPSALPGTGEYLSFAFLTDQSKGCEQTDSFMRKSRQRLIPFWLACSAATFCIALGAIVVFNSVRVANARLRQDKIKSSLQTVLTSSPPWAQDSVERFRSETSKPERAELIAATKLSSSDALGQLRIAELRGLDGDFDIDFLIESIIALSDEQYGLQSAEVHADEYPNIIRVLRLYEPREELFEIMREKFDETDSLNLDGPAPARRKTRLAIAEMHLGSDSLIAQVAHRKAKPGLNSQLLNQIRLLRYDLSEFVSFIRRVEQPDVQALLINCLTVYRDSFISGDAREQVIDLLTELRDSQLPAATYAAVLKALHRLKEGVQFRNMSNASHCETNSCGMIMVKAWSLLPEKEWTVNQHQSFMWASQTETTNGEFLKFIKSNDKRPPYWIDHTAELELLTKRRKNWPFEKANLMDAMLFCNWLSRKNHLTPVYRIKDSASLSDVTMNHSRDGYRLPTTEEWKMLAKVSPNYRKAMRFYAYSSESSNMSPAEARRKVPNPNGLFDTYGSVDEWCVHPSRAWRSSPLSRAFLLGGNYRSSRSRFRAPIKFAATGADRETQTLDLSAVIDRESGNGFRVIRNGPKKDVLYPTRRSAER